ncbi:hypothetical protein P7K49_025511, partial [Saguinus oedipus]
MTLRYPMAMGLNKGHKERHAMELLKASKDKWALKFIKKRVETHIHAKRKWEERNILAAMKK